MKILKVKDAVPDNENIVAVGNIVELEENEPSQRIVIGLNHLEKAVKLAKAFGWYEIAIRVQKDFPMLFAQAEQEKRETKGIMIAPRLIEE
jgi:hypothetical protein